MFDPHIRGLTGTPAQVAQVAKAYRVYYRKVPIEGGSYTVDHSTVVYLMRSDGSFEGVIGYQEPPDQAVAQLRELLRS
jgi:protein SCO1/2